MKQWQPIDTAPKNIVYRESYGLNGEHQHLHGPYILAYPVFGAVARVRWWESDDGKASNFLEDGGNAVRPTHWMPLPKPPKETS